MAGGEPLGERLREIGSRLIHEESGVEILEWSMVALVFALGACAVSLALETRMERALTQASSPSR